MSTVCGTLTSAQIVHTFSSAEISFDPQKDARNVRQRGLSFARAAEVDFNSALILQDSRRDYGEPRYIALCYLDARLHVLCFSETAAGIRVISFRKANAREARRHGKAKETD